MFEVDLYNGFVHVDTVGWCLLVNKKIMLYSMKRASFLLIRRPLEYGFMVVETVVLAPEHLVSWSNGEFVKRIRARLRSWNTKGGSITVPLSSCLTGLD